MRPRRGLAGRTLYLDVNNNSQIDPGEATTTTSSTGAYTFTGQAPGTYEIRAVLPSGYKQTTPANSAGLTVTLATNQVVTGKIFGQEAIATTGSVSGTVTGGPTGETVFLDANNNAKLDSGELSTTTSSAGAFGFSSVPIGSYVLRQVLATGYQQTTPTGNAGLAVSVTAGAAITGKNFTDTKSVIGGSVSGTVTNGLAGETVYLDSNNNSKFDAGELSTTTTATGAYSIANAPAGATIVRQVLPTGYTQVTPSGGTGIHVTVTGGGALVNENFIDKAPASTGSISGTIIGGLAGTTVYLDANNNSVHDTAEMATTTSSTGAFSFANVPAGAYILRQVLPTGYTQTSPSGGVGIHLTVTSTSKFTGENFTDKAPAVTHTKLTGTVIGTAGSYNNSGNTIAKAVDGSTSTFFDGQAATGDWVGLDLGSVKSVSQIAYAPRSGYASRMTGGMIQISTTADFSSGVTTIYTITGTPGSSLTTVTLSSPVTARYIRYLSPASSHGDISEFQVFA